jgi:phosphohistidine phosphatase SixA
VRWPEHKDGRLDLAEVWTSPLGRARQTAEIVAEILKAPLTECADMVPGSSVAGLAKFFAKNRPPERFMLVGHEPDTGTLLGELHRFQASASLQAANSAAAGSRSISAKRTATTGATARSASSTSGPATSPA